MATKGWVNEASWEAAYEAALALSLKDRWAAAGGGGTAVLTHRGLSSCPFSRETAPRPSSELAKEFVSELTPSARIGGNALIDGRAGVRPSAARSPHETLGVGAVVHEVQRSRRCRVGHAPNRSLSQMPSRRAASIRCLDSSSWPSMHLV